MVRCPGGQTRPSPQAVNLDTRDPSVPLNYAVFLAGLGKVTRLALLMVLLVVHVLVVLLVLLVVPVLLLLVMVVVVTGVTVPVHRHPGAGSCQADEELRGPRDQAPAGGGL